MLPLRRPRASRTLLALVCCLAVLAPAGAGRDGVAARPATAPPVAGIPAGADQGLVQERPVAPLAASGTRRDDRERPGPALLALAAAAVAAVPAWRRASGGRAHRPARRRGAAAVGPRAPPLPRPTELSCRPA
jgi:hypothetical protein